MKENRQRMIEVSNCQSQTLQGKTHTAWTASCSLSTPNSARHLDWVGFGINVAQSCQGSAVGHFTIVIDVDWTERVYAKAIMEVESMVADDGV
jgi:hypothetical protein